MGYKLSPSYIFETEDDTGIDKVPVNSIVVIKETGKSALIANKIDGITENTKIGEIFTTYRDKVKILGSSDKVPITGENIVDSLTLLPGTKYIFKVNVNDLDSYDVSSDFGTITNLGNGIFEYTAPSNMQYDKIYIAGSKLGYSDNLLTINVYIKTVSASSTTFIMLDGTDMTQVEYNDGYDVV